MPAAANGPANSSANLRITHNNARSQSPQFAVCQLSKKIEANQNDEDREVT